MAKVGAATAALPLVLSIAAPAVAATQSQIEICEILGGGFLSGQCGSCNNGGSPTICCCCHVAPGVKFCAAGDTGTGGCQERGPTHPDWDGKPSTAPRIRATESATGLGVSLARPFGPCG